MEGNTRTDLNSPQNRSVLTDVFPDLTDDVNFEILSPETPVYNYIAWAMQLTDRWVSIYNYPGFWWPDGVEKSMSPNALVHAFEAVGFTPCDSNCFEEGFDKVVLYKNEHTNEWTHASRIISDTSEYSKFGQSWDGTHSHNVLCKTRPGHDEESYGVPYAFMKRETVNRTSQGNLSGRIKTDIGLLHGLLRSRE